jgi:hypothetical protein
MNQLGFPSIVSLEEVRRERSLGGAISLCWKVAGYEAKQIQDALKVDKAQCSRWESGAEGVVWPKLKALMGFCGNTAPLLWMVEDMDLDGASLREKETEMERRLRITLERLAKLEEERRIERNLLSEIVTGRHAIKTVAA